MVQGNHLARQVDRNSVSLVAGIGPLDRHIGENITLQRAAHHQPRRPAGKPRPKAHRKPIQLQPVPVRSGLGHGQAGDHSAAMHVVHVVTGVLVHVVAGVLTRGLTAVALGVASMLIHVVVRVLTRGGTGRILAPVHLVTVMATRVVTSVVTRGLIAVVLGVAGMPIHVVPAMLIHVVARVLTRGGTGQILAPIHLVTVMATRVVTGVVRRIVAVGAAYAVEQVLWVCRLVLGPRAWRVQRLECCVELFRH